MQIKFRRRSKEYCRRRDLLLALKINFMLKITFFFPPPVLKFFNFGKPKKKIVPTKKFLSNGRTMRENNRLPTIENISRSPNKCCNYSFVRSVNIKPPNRFWSGKSKNARFLRFYRNGSASFKAFDGGNHFYSEVKYVFLLQIIDLTRSFTRKRKWAVWAVWECLTFGYLWFRLVGQ